MELAWALPATSYLFVSQRGGGFEGRRGAQTAEGPRLAGLRRLQGAAAGGADAAQVGRVGGATDHAERLAFYRLRDTIQGKMTKKICGN